MAKQDRVDLVFRGFVELTNRERSALIRRMNEYLESERRVQKELQENYQKRVVLGPLESGCPCCGR